jgi:preprotein translocase subunit SecG
VKFSIPAYSKFGKILTGLFVLIGIGLSIKGVFVYNEDKDSETWPQAPGIIIHSSLGEEENEKGEISYFADIKFQYSVDSVTYTNDRLSYWRILGSDPKIFEPKLLKYPLNKKVIVYYNPENPEQGYLEPGVSFGSFIYLIFGFLFILISIVIYIISKYIIKKTAPNFRINVN